MLVSSRLQSAAAALLAALAALCIYLPYLGTGELEHEEPRRALIARNMIESGDYLVPRYGGAVYLNKPPLYNWAIVAVATVRSRLGFACPAGEASNGGAHAGAPSGLSGGPIEGLAGVAGAAGGLSASPGVSIDTTVRSGASFDAEYSGEVDWPAMACGGRACAVVDAFSTRLPSVLSVAVLAVFMVWVTSGILAMRARMFLAAAVILAPIIGEKARLGEIDLLFTLLVSASLWTWFRADRGGKKGISLWLPASLLAGLAFLTKREPALLFFYLSTCGYLLFTRRGRELYSPGLLCSFAVVAVFAAVWLLPASIEAGAGEIWATLEREVFMRGAPSSFFSTVKHLVSYPFEALLLAAPFSFLLLALASEDVRASMRIRYGDAFVFAVLAPLINFVPYWLRGDSAARYFMPMVPTMLVAAAMVFESWSERSERVLPDGVDRLAEACSYVAKRVGLAAACLLLLSAPLTWLFYETPSPAPFILIAVFAAVVAVLIPLLAYFEGGNARVMLAGTCVVVMAALRFGTYTVGLSDTLSGSNRIPDKLGRMSTAIAREHWPAAVVGELPAVFWYYAPRGFLIPASGEPGSRLHEHVSGDARTSGGPGSKLHEHVSGAARASGELGSEIHEHVSGDARTSGRPESKIGERGSRNAGVSGRGSGSGGPEYLLFDSAGVDDTVLREMGELITLTEFPFKRGRIALVERPRLRERQ